MRFLALLSLFFISEIVGRELPSFFKPCKRTDPKLNACIKSMFETLRPFLIKGIPAMKIPPVDPFQLPIIQLKQGAGAVNFAAKFTDIVAKGANRFVINDVKVDFSVPSIYIDLKLPQLLVTCNYDIDGRILVLPIKGHGKSNGTFTDVSSKVLMTGKHVKKRDKNYVAAKDMKVSVKIGGLKIHFENLFNGNKQLGESTNIFINENWKDIIQEITPLIEDTAGMVLQELIVNTFELYSIDELLPSK